ncbi:MAG: maltotransferase domain-containing protein [Vulcanimicrobiaceae bacterium]
MVVAPLGALHRNEPLPEPPGLPVAIEAVTPAVDGGRFAAKRIAGEEVVVEADCFREGHGKLGAELRWRACDAADWQSVVLAPLENDRYRAGFVPERVGAHEFEIVAHADDVAAHATRSPRFPLVVDRQRARFGAWYEMFPRSQGSAPGRHATFAQAALRLPAIAAMGFDVLYLAPIHPIGRTQRKGRDGALAAAPGDPGSPWAIGNEHGGHDALEPRLGTFADFERFVAAAQRHDLEVALDLALQCSPDHPYVREHPEWFTFRPDGTVAYAENPPKRYEDIVNFAWEGPAAAALWAEILRVVRFWIARGVRIFRVDNPHTKPFDFWEWLIASVRAETPQTIFLAEAFTRPKVMRRLAKLGFTQSYTYFTWRNTKRELEVYLGELAQGEQAEYFRPNFFVNTPDILAPVLQRGGRAAFIMRLVLAATLGSSYGIYSGYELCENEALEGREEYAHSEKYEIKVRDWHAPGNIIGEISALNRIRREHLALHDWRTVRFLPSDDEAVLAFEKRAGDDALLVAVNLDPLAPHEATIELGGEAFVLEGLFGAEGLAESDGRLHLRLDPQAAPAHIYRIAAANRP